MHFFALFQSESFSDFFLQDSFLELELRGFTTVLVQRDEKIIKENKKKKTKPFCTLVVARLSSSERSTKMGHIPPKISKLFSVA